MRQFKALFVLALVIAIAVPAYAETQNVKVSGSIDAYAFYRANYDLTNGNDQGVVSVVDAAAAGLSASKTANTANANQQSDGDAYFRTDTQVEVSADLTDNVATVVNVVNQRDWNANVSVGGGTTAASTAITAGNEFDIELDLAYVKMKEIFYSPLTLTVGRQDMWFGRGFIIGNNSTAWDTQGVIQADEYSVTTAFDAVRATLDFNPWTIDVVYSKIQEGSHNPEDDIDLWVANVNYKFAEYNAVAEGYYVGELDRNTRAAAGGTQMNDTQTFGGRVQFDPISQITLGAELAYQGGSYMGTGGALTRGRSAWAADLFGTYRWDNAWKPEVTVEWVHFSGEADLAVGETGDYDAWNGLYRGKFWTAYADFREFVYLTTDGADQPATTNRDFIQLAGSMKPLEDLLLEAAFSYHWTPEAITFAGATRNDDLGWEVDLIATYDYTEDVSFGLLAGWFIAGDLFQAPNDDTATDLVGSLKVTF